MLRLERSYLPNNQCTLGKLTLPCGWSCLTLERPWLNNQTSISCIPEGVYTLRQRFSPVVQRTTRNEFTEGWQVEHIPGRSFIMLHPGNWACDTHGCILPGQGLGFSADKGLMVTQSRNTFHALMERLTDQKEWLLQISTQSGGRYDR